MISIPVLYFLNGTPPLVPPLLISPPPPSCSSPPPPPHSCSSPPPFPPPLLTYHHLPSLCPSFASSTCPVVSPVSQVEAAVVYETNRHTDTTNKMATYIYMCTYYITIYNPTRATYIVGQQLCRQNYCECQAVLHARDVYARRITNVTMPCLSCTSLLTCEYM